MKKTPMRRAREKAGLTLEQVATGTGIPFSTVQAFEAGRGAGYNPIRKFEIADFLKVPWWKLWPEEWEKARQFAKLTRQKVAAETELLRAHKTMNSKQDELARLKSSARALLEDGPK